MVAKGSESIPVPPVPPDDTLPEKQGVLRQRRKVTLHRRRRFEL